MPTPSQLDASGDAVRQVIRAYHGSPQPKHFDGFDAKFINSGEGHQAYGYGHYLAQNKDVADEYRRSLSYRKLRDDFLNALPEDADPADVMGSLQGFDPRQQNFLKELHANDWLGFDYPSQAISQSLGRKSGFSGYEVTDSARVAKDQLGTGYELEIAHPESAFLDWDATMMDQPPHVLEALRKLGVPSVDSVGSPIRGKNFNQPGLEKDTLFTAYGFDTPWEISGRNIYHGLSGHPAVRRYGADNFEERFKLASEALRSSGVPGIRYLDQGSRNLGPSGTRNYVMFPGTEDQIRILRKYAVPGAIGAGAAASGASEQPTP
jgi:hypothetical protein